MLDIDQGQVVKVMRRSAIHSIVFATVALVPLLGLAGCASSAESLATPLTVDVRQCGAIGDGHAIDTVAVQTAIDRIAKAGGGIVSLAAGRYVSGSLVLRSHVTLQISPDATLVGSTVFTDYRDLSTEGQPLPLSRYGQDEARFRGLLIALDAADIKITGGGTIDGRGAAVASAIHKLQASHQLAGDPSRRPDESLRPCLINFVRCHNVHVSGVTLRNSACWVEDYSGCDGLVIDHVTVHSQAFWNNDGIDICGSRNVQVSNCDIDSTDDGICLKSNASACENVDIRDCRVRSWANGIKFGTASFVGFRNVTISRCQVVGCGHAGLSIESVDGAEIKDITISDLTMTNLRQAILVKLGGRQAPEGRIGSISNLTLTDISADLADGDPDAGQPFHAPVPSYKHNRFPCIVSGLPDHPVEHLKLTRVTYRTTGGGTSTVADIPLDKLATIPENPKAYPEYSMHGELPAYGWFIRHAADLTLDSATIECRKPDSRAAVVCDDVSNLNIASLKVTDIGGGGPVVVLRDTRTASIHHGSAQTTSQAFIQTLDQCRDTEASGNSLH